MSGELYQLFNSAFKKYNIGGKVLEIGAVPTSECLLACSSLKGASERIGLNLDGGESMTKLAKRIPNPNFTIKIGNSNDMSEIFEDEEFDAVFSNATLEHDKYFWKSIYEMHRVLKSGGFMMIGVPGYVRPKPGAPDPVGTLTHRVHDWPGDFYRYSEQTCMEVFFEGFKDVEQVYRLMPPKIVTWGFKA